jgi:hypothetical protein
MNIALTLLLRAFTVVFAKICKMAIEVEMVSLIAI